LPGYEISVPDIKSVTIDTVYLSKLHGRPQNILFLQNVVKSIERASEQKIDFMMSEMTH